MWPQREQQALTPRQGHLRDTDEDTERNRAATHTGELLIKEQVETG